jgi:hypothetical protein
MYLFKTPTTLLPELQLLRVVQLSLVLAKLKK